MGVDAINAIESHIESADMKAEVLKQKAYYEKKILEGQVLKDDFKDSKTMATALETAFLKSMTKAKVMMDDSDAHIAEMLIQGCNMLIIELNQLVNHKDMDERICAYIQNILDQQQEHMDVLKKYLQLEKSVTGFSFFMMNQTVYLVKSVLKYMRV